jgi:phage tail tape-measure protein
VTADEIIKEIEQLPLQEKAEVLSVLLRSQAKKGRLSPDELVALADRMVAAQDPVEADRLEAKILTGFYGG